MMKQIIATDQAPKAPKFYSQAVRVGDLLFISGQIPIDPTTGVTVGGGITLQTERVIANIQGILSAVGADFKNVVKTTIFLADINDLDTVNELYVKHFASEPPARSAVQVANLPKGYLIEIEAIAVLK